eukprot:s180_g39.t1
MSEDLYPWRCIHCQRINKKTATKCAICESHWTTGVRHRTQPKPKTYHQDNSWQDWEQPWENEADNAWNWENWEGAKSRSLSRATIRSESRGSEPGSKGPTSRKGKGKSKMKDQSKEGKGQNQGEMATSPFAPLAKELTPWPALDSSAHSFATAPSAPSANPIAASMAQSQRDQEAVALLKQAYPDPSKMPADSKAFIEQVEKENAKAVTKNLHWTTRAMGRAQKTLADTLESKKAHRARWATHVAEALKIWEAQLQEYRQQQNAFQEVILQAKQDIDSALFAV